MGNSTQAKKEFAEFWESVEFTHVLIGPHKEVTASFRISFLNVLSLSGQLPFHEDRRNITWIGPDAALRWCGEINFANKVYKYLPTDRIPRITPHQYELDGDFIIAVAEFCSFIFPLILRGELYIIGWRPIPATIQTS